MSRRLPTTCARFVARDEHAQNQFRDGRIICRSQKYEQIYHRAMELAQQAAIQLKDKSGSQNTVPRSPFDIFFCTEHTGKDRVHRALEPLQKYINTLSLDEALFLLTLVRVGRDCMPYDKLYTSLKHFTTVAEIAPKELSKNNLNTLS